MSTIASETDLNTNIAAANGGTPTTGTFTTNVTENAAPTAITAGSGVLTLDGANFTLTGDGTDAALTLSPAADIVIENLSIANSSGAAIATSAGSVVTFETDASPAATSTISGAITGAGAVAVSTRANIWLSRS